MGFSELSCAGPGVQWSFQLRIFYGSVYLSIPFPHTFPGLIQLLGINVPHGTVLPPDVQTRAQQHSCPTPLLHHHGSGQAADAGMMNRGFSLAAAGSFPPATLPGPARCVKNQCHEAQGRPGSSWREDGHELWMCRPTLGAEGTSLHRNHGLCPTDLTDTMLDKSTPCSQHTQCPGDTARRVQSSQGHVVLWRRVARKRRNPSGQLVVEWLPTHPGAGSRRRSGSGQVVLSSWDSMDPWKSPTCLPRDALVLSLHPPRHGWCCPEPAPLKEQGGKSRVGHRNY